MINNRLIIISIVILIVACISAGCTTINNNPQNSSNSNIKGFVDHGNGVLYFKNPYAYVGSDYQDFGISLSTWLSKNPNYRVKCMIEDYHETGYYVIVEKVEVK